MLNKFFSQIGTEPCHNSQLADEITLIAINARQLPGNGFADMTIDDIKEYLKLGESRSSEETEIPKETAQQISGANIEKFQCLKSAEPADQKGNEELISLCSENDTHSSDADIFINNVIKEVSDNEISIRFDGSDEQSDEEAIIEFETEDFNEVERKTQKPTILNNSKACEQIQIINKALGLKRELLDTLGKLETQTDLPQFISGLNDLMQPYAELKKKLLQPSIKDYFK